MSNFGRLSTMQILVPVHWGLLSK